jgi:hypothetical protein
VATVADVWVLALLLFTPLVYVVVLGRRDQPAQRLNALLRELMRFWQ